jgi:ribosome-associated toxin RatA of RatAB toxin-antitoxin module
MTIIKRNAIISYSQKQMFELVNSIEEYPRFLPWCRESHIISRTESEVEAQLDIAWSGVHKTFTTKNYLHPYERMEITLVKGPFKHLEGRWSFIKLGDHGCKVNLELEFELAGGILDRMFQPIFHHMANTMVDSFCKRAVEVYGNE